MPKNDPSTTTSPVANPVSRPVSRPGRLGWRAGLTGGLAGGLATLTLLTGAASVAALATTPAPSATGAATAPTSTARFNGLEGGPVGEGQTCQGPAALCGNEVLFGLSTSDTRALGPVLDGLEKSIGTPATMLGTYEDFTEPIYVHELDRAIKAGHLPLITWEPFRSTAPTANSFPLSKIAAGKYDDYLKKRAAEAKTVNGDFLIRFGHEMNGFWYPWGQPRALHPQNVAASSNTPQQFKDAFTHIVKVFNKAGAHNVQWTWAPNLIDGNPAISLSSLYPGDRYVDVIGLSGYLATPNDTFEAKYRATLDQIAAIAPTKPLVVAETGVVAGPNRATQLRDLVSGLVTIPNLAGVIYFNHPDRNIDYRLDNHPDAAVLGQALREHHIETTLGESHALVAKPMLSTTQPLIGRTLEARYQWRGSLRASTASWYSCPAATTPLGSCARVSYGSAYTIAATERDRYLRHALSYVTGSTTDQVVSVTLGPVKTDVGTAPVAGIDLLAQSVRLRFGTAPAGATHWVVSLDGNVASYLPASTSETYFNNLPAGTTHQVSVSLCDCPHQGIKSTYSFGVVTKPSAATVTTSGSTASVTFPETQASQTGWAVSLDGAQPTTLGLTTSTTLTGLSRGSHTVSVARLAGEGSTNTTPTTFTVN